MFPDHSNIFSSLYIGANFPTDKLSVPPQSSFTLRNKLHTLALNTPRAHHSVFSGNVAHSDNSPVEPVESSSAKSSCRFGRHSKQSTKGDNEDSKTNLADLTLQPKSPSLWARVRKLWIDTSLEQLQTAERQLLQHSVKNWRLYDPDSKQDEKEEKDKRPFFYIYDVPVGTGPKGEKWYIHTVHFPARSKNAQVNDASASASSSSSSSPSSSSTVSSHVTSAPIVLVHGFGAGAGLYCLNLEQLAQMNPTQDLFAIDMLGCGTSSRPDFEKFVKDNIKQVQTYLKPEDTATATPHPTHTPTPRTTWHTAEKGQQFDAVYFSERFFVDALENWRARVGLDRINLFGHSFGGYISSVYALSFPHRLNSLFLLSPIGVPPLPPEDQHPGNRIRKLPLPVRALISGIRTLWFGSYTNLTPFSFVRFLGPLGKKPVNGYVFNRFRQADAVAEERLKKEQASQQLNEVEGEVMIEQSTNGDEANPNSTSAAKEAEDISSSFSSFNKPLVAAYAYHMCAQRGSGEYAFKHLFDSAGFAKRNIMERFTNRQFTDVHQPSTDITPTSTPTPTPRGDNNEASQVPQPFPFPVVFQYGQHDWMDVNAGQLTVDLLQQQHASYNQSLASNLLESQNHPSIPSTTFMSASTYAQIYRIPQAGHQLFIENPAGFAEACTTAFTKIAQAQSEIQRLQQSQ